MPTSHQYQPIKALVAQDRLSEAVEQLLKLAPDLYENEAIIHSARLAGLQKQIRLGLIREEERSVTMSQIRYGILETVKALEGLPQPLSVLVAGTGRRELPEEVYWTAMALGEELGKMEMKLIVGGWEGVDYVVAEHYTKEIVRMGHPLTESLIQVVSQGKEPVFRGGQVLYVPHGQREWLEAIKYADIVVLLGGEGGTYETFEYAQQERRPVIPIAGTGGDAERVFQNIEAHWDDWQNDLLGGLHQASWREMADPIHYEGDAQRIAQYVAELLPGLG